MGGVLVTLVASLSMVVAGVALPDLSQSAAAADAAGCSLYATSFTTQSLADGGADVRAGCASDSGNYRSLANSDDDVVAAIDFDVSQYPDAVHEKMAQEVTDAHADQAKGYALSEFFDQQAHAVTVGYYTPAADGTTYDGTIQVVGDSLVIVVPAAELGATGFWSGFWKKLVTGLAVAAITVLGTAACLTLLPTAPIVTPICAALVGGLAGGVSEIISAALDKKPIDAEVWGAALGTAIWGAALGAAGGTLVTYATETGAALMTGAQETLKRLAIRFVNWATPLNYVASVLNGDALAAMLARLRGLQAGASGGQIIADPSYINPAGDPSTWNTLIGSPSDKVGIAVANVLNGPGSEPVAAWTDVIDRTHASGKRVLGYVDTGYLGQTGLTTRLGSTAVADWVAQIEEDINAWYAMYGSSVDGIFFDDGFNACGAGNEFPAVYEAVNQYEKVHHPGAMTVLNPGTVVPRCYEDSADILLTFEGSYDTYENGGYQALDWTPADPRKIWHIIFGVPADKVSLVDATSRTRGAGYVYITDDVLTNPYDTLPSYWSAEEAAVPGGTSAVAAREPDVAGAALPSAPSGLTVTRSDYSSASLSWTAGANATAHLVYVNGQLAASLPASMTQVTIGGLTPGGSSYTLYVVAQGAGGDISGPSNSVGVTTLTLPGGQTITNVRITRGAGTITYSADFLVPYSFHRVEISPPGPGDDQLYWWPNGNTESCWFPGLTAQQLEDHGNFCAHWLIENSTLLVYAGTSVGDWTWNAVAYIPPTVNGYTYSWTVPTADLGDAVDYVDVQGEGYGPLTNVIAGTNPVG
ncbi:spherulation-specific family 4 protein [Streptomyces sp. NPDC048278]|uniref:spherulation-specific family 4 protein n=1 Tax=Streptomyces sp. NPDC048278 TaxID=3155809 RepID=UPI00343AC820